MTSRCSSESLIAAAVKGWQWSLTGFTCHGWPVIEDRYKQWVILKWHKLCLLHIFSGKSGFGYWPPACPPCCSWPRYPVGCSTEVSIKAVTPLDKVFLPTVLPPQTQKASSFAGVRGKGAAPHPWNWTSVDFNESCVAKSHATLKLEGLNPFCFCLLVCGWEKQNSHVFWIALTDKSGQQLRVNHSISAHPQPSLIYVYILKWLSMSHENSFN